MYQVSIDNNNYTIDLSNSQDSKGSLNGSPFELDVLDIQPGVWHVIKNKRSYTIISEGLSEDGHTVKLKVNGKPIQASVKDKMDLLLEQMGFNAAAGKKVNDLKAPMPGLVLRILVQEGSSVQKGDTLLVLEAMKMENTIKSPGEGVISKILVNNGQAVEKGQVMVTFS